jgi:hypothetical protein
MPSEDKCEKHTIELLTLKKEQEEMQRSISRHKVCSDATDIKLNDHLRMSVDRIEKMVKHDNQILSLERAHLDVMEDLKSIKQDIKEINKDIFDIKTAQKTTSAEIKNWILIGIITGVSALSGTIIFGLISVGSMSKQLEINTKKWEAHDAGFYDKKSSLGN